MSSFNIGLIIKEMKHACNVYKPGRNKQLRLSKKIRYSRKCSWVINRLKIQGMLDKYGKKTLRFYRGDGVVFGLVRKRQQKYNLSLNVFILRKEPFLYL